MKTRFNMVSCFVARPVADVGHEILQLRRRRDDYMGGTWQTIYGQGEEGESAIVGVLRELREEAGLIPVELYRLQRVSVFYVPIDDTIWHSVPFFAMVAGDSSVTLNDEHDASRWLPIDGAESHFMWRDDRLAIQEIREEILGDGPAKSHMRIYLP